MCGIVGIVSLVNKDFSLDLGTMSNLLRHRGPDSDGVWIDHAKGIYLGHRRLAIQDLSEAGHQPMVSKSRRFIITYNGEIYNFPQLKKQLQDLGLRFDSHSDTEVLLASCDTWGVQKTLEKIKGMFAFAIYDRSTNKITLARDRFGEKPLFYMLKDGIFSFSSELKSFNNLSFYRRETNRNAIINYLQFGYTQGEQTLYNNVNKLEPGMILTYTPLNQKIEKEVYWSLDSAYEKGKKNIFKGTLEDAVSELDDLLNKSISGQLISDAPLGTFLSGGIDSSLITAIASRNSKNKLDTFSIGFEDPKYNEAPCARKIANFLGTNHHELILGEADCLDLVTSMLDVYDEPFFDSSALPTMLLSKFAKQTVTVALSGDGGDELFWGYGRYSRVKSLWGTFKKIPVTKKNARLLNTFSQYVLGDKSRFGNKVNRALHLLGRKNIGEFYQSTRHIFTDIEIANLLNKNIEQLSYCSDEYSEYDKVPLSDAKDYLANDILVKVDRAAMRSSLETRVPLLDHELAEFALSLPASYRSNNGLNKIILRKLLTRYVPLRLFDRKKKGFSVPLGNWFKGALRDWGYDVINKGEKNEALGLNYDVIKRLFNYHILGGQDYSTKIWLLIMLIHFEMS